MAKTYTVYTYFRSSCSARVRIAAHLKGIETEYKFIHLLNNDQQSESYASVNPSQSVPTLVVAEDGKEVAVIRQSIAILEYWEETFPDSTPLLPPLSDPVARAKVRDLVNIVCCDIQPVTNLRILRRIRPAGIDANEWQQQFMTAGFRAYETLAAAYAGKYSFGDMVTLADVVLAPAVDGALRFGVDIAQFPTVSRIAEELKQVDGFVKGNWRNQPDTPEEVRSARI
jgi:maleylacetoacetate isomerase